MQYRYLIYCARRFLLEFVLLNLWFSVWCFVNRCLLFWRIYCLSFWLSLFVHLEAINKAYLINMEIRTNEFMLFFQLMMATWYSGRVKVINFPLHWPNMSLSLAWFIFIIFTTAFAVFIMAFILLTCQRVVHLSFVFVR
jgi:hypothetical protein